MKSWYQSKTLWLNVITALVMILDLLSKQPFIPPQYVPIVLFAVAMLNVILRVWFTDTGIASSATRKSTAAPPS